MTALSSAELLQVAESVARDKGLNREVVLKAIEEAISAAGRKKYGHEHYIKAEVSRKSGIVNLYRVRTVVDKRENNFTEITLEEARAINSDYNLGDKVFDPLPPIDLGRMSAQIARQIIVQHIKEAERNKEYHDFKSRVGDILSGMVKRIEPGNIVVDIGGRAEAIIYSSGLLPNDSLKVGDRIRAYVYKVVKQDNGPQIFLSRANEGMLAKLFELEVPEIYDNLVQIKAIARDPGSKSKLAVFASDPTVDPVGCCVGVRGNRVQSVTNEFNGEKIDIVQWHNDIAQFAINALTPATISKVIIHKEKHKIEVVVPIDQLNVVIGRKGQNVKLAAKLIGWNIDIMSDEQQSKKRLEEFNSSAELFIKALDVDEVLAQLLVSQGFTTVEQIAVGELSKLYAIEGFDEDLALELKNRASAIVDQKNNSMILKLERLGVEQELLDFLDDIKLEDLIELAEYGIKSIEDLGEIKVSEFKQLLKYSNVDVNRISELIKAARGFNFSREVVSSS